MQLHRFDDIKEFGDRTQAHLLQYEAEHNLLLGLSHTLLHHPDRYPHPPYLAIVEIKGQIVAVAIRTPPHKLILSKTVEPAALELIANDLYNHQETVPGVSGLVASVICLWKQIVAICCKNWTRLYASRVSPQRLCNCLCRCVESTIA